MEKRSVNLIPFKDGYFSLSETILNVIVFVPLGIYAGVLLKRFNFGAHFFLYLVCSSFFEVNQFVFKIGAFDITDILTNTLGGIIGLLTFKAIESVFQNRLKTERFINKIAFLATVLMITLLLLLKMNKLPIRYQ